MDSKTGKIEYKDGIRLRSITASVRCNCCHSRGPTVSIEYSGYRDGIQEEIEARAFNAWNNRG